jgi:hypothetical protein
MWTTSGFSSATQVRRSSSVPLSSTTSSTHEMVAAETHSNRTEMRFTRFPRGEHQPSPPSARRVAPAKRAVQAEKDRYPLFPELVRYATTESRLAAMQEHRTTGGNSTVIAASWREARASLRSLPPRAGILLRWQTCSLLRSLEFTSLVCCTITEPESVVSRAPWPNCAG